jgi:hypothetical protein
MVHRFTDGLRCPKKARRRASGCVLAIEGRHCGQHLMGRDLADQHAERRDARRNRDFPVLIQLASAPVSVFRPHRQLLA